MSEPNYRDWILETIDSLRGRKARPDLERICRMVRRRHGTDPERTRAELETLIQERTVLKVSYKGSISYRNAAKVHRKCRKGAEEIAEASGSKHTGLPRRDDDNGESVSELEEGTGDRESDPTASVCEEEEVAQENSLFCGKTSALREMSPGAEEQRRFPVQTPGDCDEEQEQQEEEDEETSHKDAPPPKRLKSSPEESASGLGDRLVEAVRSLSGGHRRHAPPPGLKEILELLSTQSATPDEKLTRHRVNRELEREIARGRLRRTRLGHITVPGRARPERAPRDGRSAETDKVKTEETLDGASAEDVSRSSSAENRDQTVSDEDLTHTHPEPDDVINPAPTSERKPQSLASSSFLPQEVEAGAVSVSQRNTESVDLKPTRPQLQDPPEMMAETVKLPSSVPPPDCSECKLEVAASSCLLTPSASPGGGEDPNMDGLMKPEMSPADWTVADVVRYFTAAGFPEQALAFRTQEIDGKSLLLMRRNDVLMGLSIKLGPALKIYERHVKVLQRSLFHEDSMFC